MRDGVAELAERSVHRAPEARAQGGEPRLSPGHGHGTGTRQKGLTMTTVQITLPDELAQKAASAGLLSPEAMEAMLREQLRRTAAQALRSMWERAPAKELTPEIEQEIVQAVRAARAERRRRGAS